MAVSIKLALLICMGAVGAVTLAVQSITPPRERLEPPFTAENIRARYAQADRARARVAGVREDRRTGLVRGLERPSWPESAAFVNLAAGPPLALLPPAEPSNSAAAPPALPPLVYGDEQALASTAEPAAEEVVLAAADGAELQASAGEQPPAPEPRRYRVAKGDTLMRIVGREYKTRDPRVVQLVADLNPAVGQRRNRVQAGEEILLPDADRVQAVLAKAPSGVALAAALPAKSPAAATTLRKPPTAQPRWYTIQRNDSLKRIAERQLKDASRWREIAALNRSVDPHKLAAGARIKLPPALKVAGR